MKFYFLEKLTHPTATFITIPVALTPFQRHIGLYCDEKLNFSQHILKISKAIKGIGILKKAFTNPSKKVPYNYLQIFH